MPGSVETDHALTARAEEVWHGASVIRVPATSTWNLYGGASAGWVELGHSPDEARAKLEEIIAAEPPQESRGPAPSLTSPRV